VCRWKTLSQCPDDRGRQDGFAERSHTQDEDTANLIEIEGLFGVNVHCAVETAFLAKTRFLLTLP
jgi:hypothetical protein